MNWTRLSDVGQTYGAISAIVSAVALGGVAAALFFQARQAKAERIQAVRGFHRELIQMTIDEPTRYLPCWAVDTSDIEQERQPSSHFFCLTT